MERSESTDSLRDVFPDEPPSPSRYRKNKRDSSSNNVEDVVESDQRSLLSGMPNSNPSFLVDKASFRGDEADKYQSRSYFGRGTNGSHPLRSVSVSVPTSSGLHIDTTRKFTLNSEDFRTAKSTISPGGFPGTSGRPPRPRNHHHSQPLGNTKSITPDGRRSVNFDLHQRFSRNDEPKDKRFDSFKTWSGKFERQLSHFRGKPAEPEPDVTDDSQTTEIEPLPVDRYFDALEGPELDVLRPSEVSALPEDKVWPFLLRFPISSFGICLGVGSQAILWKTLATASSTRFLNMTPYVNEILWYIAIVLMVTVFSTYALKFIFYFEAVRREYYHPIRVNFFFAPWIASLFLVLGVPPSIAVNIHSCVWYVLMTPILCLELKIYGQWISGGQRRLSKVANPSNHLSIVGNFVGALLGATLGLKEGPTFFFAVGLAHYIVLFVTLYQRLPTNEMLPKDLHPVFFLFVAAPSVACTAWARIRGDFDYGSRIAYFIAMFLYFSLAVRINFFRGIRFSLAWWAYTFPMTAAATATIRYSMEVKNPFTQTLAVFLSAVSTITVTALFITTVLHAFVMRDLFPNDISIAITETKQGKDTKDPTSKTSGPLDLEAAITMNILGHQVSI